MSHPLGPSGFLKTQLQVFNIKTYIYVMSMMLGQVMCCLVNIGCKDTTKAVGSESVPANLSCVKKHGICFLTELWSNSQFLRRKKHFEEQLSCSETTYNCIYCGWAHCCRKIGLKVVTKRYRRFVALFGLQMQFLTLIWVQEHCWQSGAWRQAH